MGKVVHVAVGVLGNSRGQILIAKRAATAHQGGLWEFPGGKVEPNESVPQALARELHEELGVRCQRFTPLIQITHDYGDKKVLLDVHRVRDFTGRPHGAEGQPLRWVPLDELKHYAFPAANRPIINALTLPVRLLITGAAASDSDFSRRLKAALERGITLVRARGASAVQCAMAQRLCQDYGANLVLDKDINGVRAYGRHLNAATLMALTQRPEGIKLLGASCHTAHEVAAANRLGVDYLCLSPVQPTASHPQANALGWEAFTALAAQAQAPVYALGGMDESHLALAQVRGAQGIAAIRAWW